MLSICQHIFLTIKMKRNLEQYHKSVDKSQPNCLALKEILIYSSTVSGIDLQRSSCSEKHFILYSSKPKRVKRFRVGKNISQGTDYGRTERKQPSRPKIQSHSQIFRYGQSIFCLPHRPNFSDIFDLCLHWVSVVRVLTPSSPCCLLHQLGFTYVLSQLLGQPVIPLSQLHFLETFYKFQSMI